METHVLVPGVFRRPGAGRFDRRQSRGHERNGRASRWRVARPERAVADQRPAM